jgi:hypothetical protein
MQKKKQLFMMRKRLFEDPLVLLLFTHTLVGKLPANGLVARSV